MCWCPPARNAWPNGRPRSPRTSPRAFLAQGSFEHPADGITLYIREITPEGELRDLFLTDTRDPARQVTYTAQRALVVRAETGPKLVMFEGLAQILSTRDGGLATTTFKDFTL